MIIYSIVLQLLINTVCWTSKIERFSSDQKPGIDRGIRVRLLVHGYIRNLVGEYFDTCFPPRTLKFELQFYSGTFQRYLVPQQKDVVFPRSGIDPSSKDFDVALLIMLIRNIPNKTGTPVNGYDCLPNSADVSIEDDLARIKHYRNYLAHKVLNLSIQEFESIWKVLSEVALRLNGEQKNIDTLKTGNMDYESCDKEDIKNCEVVKMNMSASSGGVITCSLGASTILISLIKIASTINMQNKAKMKPNEGEGQKNPEKSQKMHKHQPFSGYNLMNFFPYVPDIPEFDNNIGSDKITNSCWLDTFLGRDQLLDKIMSCRDIQSSHRLHSKYVESCDPFADITRAIEIDQSPAPYWLNSRYRRIKDPLAEMKRDTPLQKSHDTQNKKRSLF